MRSIMSHSLFVDLSPTSTHSTLLNGSYCYTANLSWFSGVSKSEKCLNMYPVALFRLLSLYSHWSFLISLTRPRSVFYIMPDAKADLNEVIYQACATCNRSATIITNLITVRP